jgi:hypothetical protein
MALCISNPTDPYALSFLKLPSEIRNFVYASLFHRDEQVKIVDVRSKLYYGELTLVHQRYLADTRRSIWSTIHGERIPVDRERHMEGRKLAGLVDRQMSEPDRAQHHAPKKCGHRCQWARLLSGPCCQSATTASTSVGRRQFQLAD